MNFITLMTLLFVFAIAVDLLLNVDRFVDAGRAHSEGRGALATFFMTIWYVFDFQAPRIFLFYGYMHGLAAIGAMAFTLAQMQRNRELVALLASGVNLFRVAMPLIVATFVISLVQLVNQEFLTPVVAPLLLRDHGQIGERTLEEFAVPLTPDSRGNILQSPAFHPDPLRPVLDSPTILEVDELGRTSRRITAQSAKWNPTTGEWDLTGGTAVRSTPAESDAGSEQVRESVTAYQSDLTPEALTMRRHGQFAAMLSLKQIQEMLRTPDVVNTAVLVRYKYARFAVVLVNLFVMGLALPTFLQRAPVPLLKQAALCAAISIPALTGAGIGMNVNLPGISPAVGVFLPVILLSLLLLARWTYFRT